MSDARLRALQRIAEQTKAPLDIYRFRHEAVRQWKWRMALPIMVGDVIEYEIKSDTGRIYEQGSIAVTEIIGYVTYPLYGNLIWAKTHLLRGGEVWHYTVATHASVAEDQVTRIVSVAEPA